MKYDYIFVGFGLSSMLVLFEMSKNKFFFDKKILIIEPQSKTEKDRTWCYWETSNGAWDFLLKNKWESAWFQSGEIELNILKTDVFYKMIESDDLYAFVKNIIKINLQTEWVSSSVTSISDTKNEVIVQTDASMYHASKVFNAVIFDNCFKNNKQYPLINQHFLGWFVAIDDKYRASMPAIFMDFNVMQHNNTRFMYVLPCANNQVLIEYTLFSKNLLHDSEYELEIKQYLNSKQIFDYTIQRKEKGCIPMTAYPFWNHNTENILNIGTAGGWTKASTGFTFSNSRKKALQVVTFLQKKQNLDFKIFHSTSRYYFYDQILIEVLSNSNHLGKLIFTKMFTKSDAASILRFLDESSTFWEELQIIWACPKWPFIKAFFKVLFKNFKKI